MTTWSISSARTVFRWTRLLPGGSQYPWGYHRLERRPVRYHIPVYLHLGEKRSQTFSLGLVSSREIEQFGRKQLKFEISGVTILTTWISTRSSHTLRESYRLDVIAG